jgi:hypothetical protein
MHQPASSRITRTLATWDAALLGVRWVVRAPIWLHQTRLGILLGSRLLMLEHIGRHPVLHAMRYWKSSTTPHQTPTWSCPASVTEPNGSATSAPTTRARLPRQPHTSPAMAQLLTQKQTAAALAVYSTAHPRAWATLKPVLESGRHPDCGGTSGRSWPAPTKTTPDGRRRPERDPM